MGNRGFWVGAWGGAESSNMMTIAKKYLARANPKKTRYRNPKKKKLTNLENKMLYSVDWGGSDEPGLK